MYGSSLSSNSKGSRSILSNDQYPNHHHSVSDGALSYFGSPSDNLQPPRWTPPRQKFSYGDFASPSARGSRPGSSLFPRSAESRFTTAASAVSNFGSPSPLSESAFPESTITPPISFPQRNFSGRRSFMSKPVYPLVFRNPVSDGETFGPTDVASGSRSVPSDNRTLSLSPDGTASLELKKMEASPDPSSSSRREGFRWSNASSYDMGFEGEIVDITDHIDSANLRPATHNAIDDQKCGLCGRLLSQKSPWSSYRIVRTGDMPIAGVLSCSHVFHAECLDQTTPKTQIHDPPCPVCQKTVSMAEASPTMPEPLQMALRSVRRNHGIANGGGEGSSSRPSADQMESPFRRNRSLPMPRRGGASLIKNHFKKHFSFKGTGKDLFTAKVFRRDP